MKRGVLSLVLAGWCGVAAAQAPDWTAPYDSGPGPEPAFVGQGVGPTRHLAVDQSGSVYVLGNLGYCLLVKYRSDGSVAWQRVVAEQCTGVRVLSDGQGHVYAVGSVSRPLPAAWTAAQSTAASLVVKYDGDGTRLWTRFWDGGAPEAYSPPRSAAANALGVVVTGTTLTDASDPNTRKIATRRYDAAGTLLWETVHGDGSGPFDAGDVSLDAQGRVTVVGSGPAQGLVLRYTPAGVLDWVRLGATYSGALLAADDEGSAWTANQDALGAEIIKWAADGQELWRTSHLPPTDFPSAIAVSEGVSAVSGPFSIARIDATGAVSWTRDVRDVGSPALLASIGLNASGTTFVAGWQQGANSDYVVRAYDQAGNLAWQRTHDWGNSDSEAATALAVADDGSIRVSGNAATGTSGTGDVGTLRYDAAGTPQWAARMPMAPRSDGFAALALDGDRHAVVSSYSRETGAPTLRRYTPDGSLAWSAAGTDLRYLAPHPLGGVAGAGWAATVNGTELRVERYDASGNRLWSTPYEHPGTLNSPAALVVDRAGNTLVLIGETLCNRFCFVALWRLARYNRSGILDWAQPIEPAPGGGPLSTAGLAVDAAGSIYVSGRGQVNGIALSRYDGTGSRVWTREWQSPGAGGSAPRGHDRGRRRQHRPHWLDPRGCLWAGARRLRDLEVRSLGQPALGPRARRVGRRRPPLGARGRRRGQHRGHRPVPGRLCL